VTVAIVGLAVLTIQPTAGMVFLLVVAQELNPDGGGFASQWPHLALGHEVYFTRIGGFPLIELAALVAAAAAGLRARSIGRPGRLLMVAIVGAILAGLAFHQGLSLRSALGAPVRPVVLLTCGLVLASTTAGQRGGWPRVGSFAIAGLFVELGMGVISLANGQAPEALSIYYDSALPAAAGAILIAVCFTTPIRGRVAAAAVAAGAVVLLSGRRGVWAGAVFALCIILVARRDRAGALMKTAVAALALVAIVWIASPDTLVSAGHRSQEAWVAVSGGASDASTSGHVDDLHYGWMWARAGDFWGYGFSHRPMFGLAVQGNTQLYVHNEYLLVWLRFGIPGLILSIGTMVAALWVSARRFRSSETHVLAGAAFVWLAAFACMTAPFLSTTSRWPVLFGIALGAALTSPTGGSDGLPPPTAVRHGQPIHGVHYERLGAHARHRS